ncbi:MAG TPA: hypothetical protein VK179_09555 [Bacteroidales bacterium]|nr:hypothetical protein [Bacteroidales bacterium]
MKTLFVSLCAALVFFNAGAQQKDHKVVTSDKTDWYKLGETTVSFNTDRDEISVSGADKFGALKFKVMDVPIHLMSLEAYFDDGGKQDINVNFPIKPQGESRVIEIKGGERDLKKVVFVYKTLANRSDREARVELWGLKTNEDKH